MTITTERYAYESVERLIKLLVQKGVISEQERKQIHEEIVADYLKPTD